ncbi:MAG: hypothetical protein HY647_11155 [Acidobacteria bacterium]|nr:hypothetical protein [Acidobacteriota bacterium]
MLSVEKVRNELARYEHPLFEFSCREKGESVEVIIDFRDDLRKRDLGLHTYYFEIHPRDLQHPQFPWTFQRQLYDCIHDYIVEMFTRTPQMK